VAKEKYSYIKKYLEDSADVARNQINLIEDFLEIAEICKNSLIEGNTIFFCGNGGSASDAQHLAAELVGRFKINRAPLKAISLTTDTSIITAISNDFGYEKIFVKQLEALSNKGDILIAISTSGESPSILNAVEFANKNELISVGFTNNEKNSLAQKSKYKIQIPSNETGIVQQGHITFGQLLCFYLEKEIFG
jgi:D-sedoheptulose 7-phosphate isomerase